MTARATSGNDTMADARTAADPRERHLPPEGVAQERPRRPPPTQQQQQHIPHHHRRNGERQRGQDVQREPAPNPLLHHQPAQE